MKSSETAVAERQQKHILLSARNCFIARGLAKTTMRDIAAQAEMSLGNIYRYFKNKDALLTAFIASDMESADDAFSFLQHCSDVRTGLVEIAEGYISQLAANAELLIYVDMLSQALRDTDKTLLHSLQEDTRVLSRHLQQAADQGKISITMPADTAAMAIMSVIESIAIKRLTDKTYTLASGKGEFTVFLKAVIA